MARRVVAASQQFLQRAQAVVSAAPFTVLGWAKPHAVGTLQFVWAIPGGGIGNQFQVHIRTDGTLQSTSGDSTGSSNVITSGTVVAGSWNLCGAIFNGAAQSAVLNAEVAAATVTERIPTSLNSTRIGAGSPNTLDGHFAEWAIWNVALSPEEIASLYAAGPLVPSPQFVRPDALVAHWRLLDDDDDRDYVGAFHLTPFNNPTYSQHPAVVYPTAPHFTYVRAAAGIRPTGIASAEAFGTPSIAHAIAPAGIASAEAFGSAFVGSLIRPTAIDSAEAFGTPTVVVHTELEPDGIASAEAFGDHWIGDHQIIIPFGIESAESVGNAGLTVELLRRVRPRCAIFASDRPFAGQGISLYANTGEQVIYRTPRVVARRFRRHRRVWTKATTPRLPLGTDPVKKTNRLAFVAGTAGQEKSIAINLPSDWAGETIVIDTRHFRDDVEHLSSNWRTLRADLDGSLEEVADIRGTAELLTVEIRAAGVVRIRFAWKPARDGLQPALFRIQRTAGPTSPAEVTTAAIAGQRIYEIDTPALDDSAPYTYRVRAENGSTVLDLLTGIQFTADATGPPAVTQVLTDAR